MRTDNRGQQWAWDVLWQAIYRPTPHVSRSSRTLSESVSTVVVAIMVVILRFQCRFDSMLIFCVVFVFWYNFYMSLQPKTATSAKSYSPIDHGQQWIDGWIDRRMDRSIHHGRLFIQYTDTSITEKYTCIDYPLWRSTEFMRPEVKTEEWRSFGAWSIVPEPGTAVGLVKDVKTTTTPEPRTKYCRMIKIIFVWYSYGTFYHSLRSHFQARVISTFVYGICMDSQRPAYLGQILRLELHLKLY